MDAGAGAGRVGLGDEENKLKERSLNWVLAGGSDLSDAGWLSAVARAALGTRSKHYCHCDFRIVRVFPGGSLYRWSLPLYRHSLCRYTPDVVNSQDIRELLHQVSLSVAAILFSAQP